jgi:hypothetical protein
VEQQRLQEPQENQNSVKCTFYFYAKHKILYFGYTGCIRNTCVNSNQWKNSPIYVKERQQYNLRNCEDFDLQLCKFNPKCNSLYHQGLMLFNQLPIDIKACNDLSNFKHMLRVYIIDNY